jgi:hypothetical protein
MIVMMAVLVGMKPGRSLSADRWPKVYEPAYGELLGHHLREGFGTTTRPDLGMQWYNAALTALETGAPPAFMPGQPERVQLVRQATLQLNGGRANLMPVPAAQPVPVGNAMPTFRISQ